MINKKLIDNLQKTSHPKKKLTFRNMRSSEIFCNLFPSSMIKRSKKNLRKKDYPSKQQNKKLLCCWVISRVARCLSSLQPPNDKHVGGAQNNFFFSAMSIITINSLSDAVCLCLALLLLCLPFFLFLLFSRAKMMTLHFHCLRQHNLN